MDKRQYNLSFLHIEDQPKARKIFKQNFSKIKYPGNNVIYKLKQAKSPVEARKLYFNNGDYPDLALVDVKYEEKYLKEVIEEDGITFLLNSAKEYNWLAPVIIFTGFAKDKDRSLREMDELTTRTLVLVERMTKTATWENLILLINSIATQLILPQYLLSLPSEIDHVYKTKGNFTTLSKKWKSNLENFILVREKKEIKDKVPFDTLIDTIKDLLSIPIWNNKPIPKIISIAEKLYSLSDIVNPAGSSIEITKIIKNAIFDDVVEDKEDFVIREKYQCLLEAVEGEIALVKMKKKNKFMPRMKISAERLYEAGVDIGDEFIYKVLTKNSSILSEIVSLKKPDEKDAIPVVNLTKDHFDMIEKFSSKPNISIKKKGK